jgi:predicted TIM-barrel fold metal-dependent hydrolase
MKKHNIGSNRLSVLIVVVVQISLFSCSSGYYSEADFFKVKKIDAHVHILTTDPSLQKHALQENLKFITINVDAGEDVKMQRDTSVMLMKKFPGRVNYLASFAFDTAAWNSGDWEKKTIGEIEQNIAGGAVGVKIWKNIGMTFRERNGKFIMISNNRFDPVISYIEKRGLPLTGHLGEPKNCWLPIDSMTVSNDKRYFKDHPEYHMYLHPEYPSYQAQIAARDSMLSKHPNLKFIGCHLGSLEWDVDVLAKTLDRFPNMAVDLAARICHLQYQSAKNRDKVRDFLIKYQDRILYGTDMGYAGKPDSNFYANMHASRLSDWNYFTGSMALKSKDVNMPFTGLHLPKTVVDKIFYENAVRWYKPDLQ